MAKVDLDLNSREFRDMLRSDQFRPALHDIAMKVAARARSTAPVDTGAYRDSISVESHVTDRAVERVVAHDPKSSIIEAKTGNLKRALGA